MLRALVVLLLLANGLFFAWTQGWLDSIVGPPRADREPQRLAAQVRPEQVQILPPGAAASAASGPASAASASANAAAASVAAPLAASAVAGPTGSGASSAAGAASAAPVAVATAVTPQASRPAAAPVGAPAASAAGSNPAAPTVLAAATPASASAGTCLEAGPFAPGEVAAAEAALRPTLAAGSWSQRRTQGGGEWMIYMGPYPDREFLERKKAELSRIRGGVPQEELSAPPELARGLSLGRFPSPTAANATLAQYRQRGIRTARVLQSSSGQPQVFLRVAQAEPGTAAALGKLKLAQGTRSFTACPR